MLDKLPHALQHKVWQTFFTIFVLPHILQPDGWQLTIPEEHHVATVAHEQVPLKQRCKLYEAFRRLLVENVPVERSVVKHIWTLYNAFSRKFEPLMVKLIGVKFWRTDAENVELEIGGLIVWRCAHCAKGQVMKPQGIAWPLSAVQYHNVKVMCIAPPECGLSVHYIDQDQDEYMEAFAFKRVEIPFNRSSHTEQEQCAVFSMGMVGLKYAY